MSTTLPPRRLTSWKEIAAFLGRDVRTVQRWERDGLPVHRRPGGKRSGVFAYESDLESWLAGRAEGTSPTPAETGQSSPPSPSWPSAHVLAAVGVVVVLSVGAIWVAAARREGPPATASPRLLATSNTALQSPRWADADGDGEPDLIVSAESAVLIFRSAKQKTCAADAERCADTRIQATAACDLHASHVADFNDDGHDDLLVSCMLREPESYAATGPTFIVWGRPVWPAALALPADAGVTIATDAAHDDRVHGCLHGSDVADLNGDGIADVLLGGDEVPFKGRLSSGAVYVFFGRRAWPRSLLHQDANVTIGGSRMAEGLGAKCAAGDFDGDGHVDLVAYGDEMRLWELLGGSGRAYIIPGRAEWPRAIDLAHQPAMRIDGLPSGTLGPQLAMADLDHDGKQDLFFSAPISRRNPREGSIVSIWKGGPWRQAVSPFSTADTLIKGASAASRFGVSMVPSDLDQDGRREILISDPGAATLNILTTQRLTGGHDLPPDIIASEVSADHDSMTIHDDTVAIITFDAGSWRVSLLQPFSTVSIDVRPYNADDVIVRPGVAAIGMIGRRGAPLIEADSLRAAGARPIAHSIADINGDGIPDLVGRFRTEEMNLHGEATALTLIGRTRRGDYVRGASAVRVVSVTAATVR